MPLPIENALPALKAALASSSSAVLEAPPGAGKTTLVPLALLSEPWLASRRIVMLEPRRIAARMAAARMASTLGESVGETVGYRIRSESRVGPKTRIEVVTEGILTRRLQGDPGLDGVGLVIFDEFHERSLHADLGLALCLEAQAALRPDLRLLVMSATLDGDAVGRLLGGAPVVRSEGRSYPVETRYLDREPASAIEPAAASALERVVSEHDGDVLAFLPGEAEIRRVERLLLDGALDPGVTVAPLYGGLKQEQQDSAIQPSAPGRRKIVLATSIAETSLTIEGVRVVVDGGLSRLPKFDPRTGMTRLETVRVSKASADQRRGRAGRLGPGLCYRLWTEAQHRGLPEQTPPEILNADLAPLALELAQWGVGKPDALAWLDPPPAAAFGQGQALLQRLDALDAEGRITEHGRRMASLGAHPRLAHMMLKGKELGLGWLACEVAAILGERDFVRTAPGQRDADIRLRVDLLRDTRDTPVGAAAVAVDRGARMAAGTAAKEFRRQLRVAERDERNGHAVGLAVALAYPDRIAQRRSGMTGSFRLSNGRGATLPAGDPLAAEDWLAVAALDAGQADARIFLAAPVAVEELEEAFADRIRSVEFIDWEAREQAVFARRQDRLGELALRDRPLANPPKEKVAAALLKGIRASGLQALPWTPDLRSWQARILFLRDLEGGEAEWPDVSDAALLATLEDWLAPFLDGVTRLGQLQRIDLAGALRSHLSWDQARRLDAEAPTHLTVPSGASRPLDYSGGPAPVLALRLQELFGATSTPTVAGGKVAVMLHLLSPAGRPVQVTQDLISFWANTYDQVRRDLKGRYPKHHWPDNPMTAIPTAYSKRRAGN